jgi:hypothetical protein
MGFLLRAADERKLRIAHGRNASATARGEFFADDAQRSAAPSIIASFR